LILVDMEATQMSRPEIRLRSSTRVELELGRDVVEPFRRAAAARGTTVPGLVRDLLVVIAADKLVDAVLDSD